MSLSDSRQALADSCDAIYQPLSSRVLRDPYPVFHRLRSSGSVRWHAHLDSWVVPSHSACVDVLERPNVFASDFRRLGEHVPDEALSVQMLDPPEHTPIRHLLAAAMRERDVRSLTDDVRRIVGERLRATDDTATFDFITAVARPVALDTISYALGMRAPNGAEFEAVSNAIVRSMDGGLDPARVQPGVAARRTLAAWVERWMDEASDGLLGYVGTHRGEYDVSAALVANSLRAVLHAGYESVSRLLGNAVAVMVGQPEVLTACARVPVAAAVDEFVRYDPPVQADARGCVTDAEIAGHPVRRGDVVILLLGAANRDPAVFQQPDSFVPDRSPNRHLGFGLGVHACLGAHLARAVLHALLEALLTDDRMLVAAGIPVREPTATLRGLTSLPTRWQARPALGGSR